VTVGVRLIAVVCTAAVLFVAALFAFAQAADATHPLVPSSQHLEAGTLTSAGNSRPDQISAQRGQAQLLREGAELYGVHCATCHGADLKGGESVPPLLRAGGAAVDFYMTTGRMPLAVKASADGDAARIIAAGAQAYHVAPLFNPTQIAAIDAYVGERATASVAIPNVQLDDSKLQRGRLLFEDNCEACHGAAAEGATVGYQWTALPLNRATPEQIGEAMRIGPGVMPRFSSRQFSDDDIDAIATYVRYLATTPQTYGGTVVDYLGPTAEGAVGAFIGVGFLFWVIYFTGTKSDGRRVNDLD
jgi:ubiquinol-cytochrome c reductase cytochrome c subunit